MYNNIILMFYIIIHNISFYVSMLSMNRSFFDRTVRCNGCAASPRLPPVDNLQVILDRLRPSGHPELTRKPVQELARELTGS
jgi:hypothetical protein